MIEAMATGTPVIAWGHGSVPEIIDHGVSGLVVSSIEEALAAVGVVRSMDRTTVRESFEKRFAASRMARDYIKAFEALVQDSDEGSALRRSFSPVSRHQPRVPHELRSGPLRPPSTPN
jgi:hypothetical protein